MKWKIRQETDGDADRIEAITTIAFAEKSFASGAEGQLPAKLREAGALVLSLVATIQNQVVGHVALSPAKMGEAQCLGLGPVAVSPEFQGQGIGTDLVQAALTVAQAYGRDAVVLMGDPNFYGQLGFVQSRDMTYKGAPSNALQAFAFTNRDLSGDVTFHAAFDD